MRCACADARGNCSLLVGQHFGFHLQVLARMAVASFANHSKLRSLWGIYQSDVVLVTQSVAQLSFKNRNIYDPSQAIWVGTLEVHATTIVTPYLHVHHGCSV